MILSHLDNFKANTHANKHACMLVEICVAPLRNVCGLRDVHESSNTHFSQPCCFVELTNPLDGPIVTAVSWNASQRMYVYRKQKQQAAFLRPSDDSDLPDL